MTERDIEGATEMDVKHFGPDYEADYYNLEDYEPETDTDVAAVHKADPTE